MLRSAQSQTILLLAVAITACTASPPAANPEPAPRVELRGDTLVYRGPVGAAGNALIFEAAAAAPVRVSTLVITSNGGDIEAGMELGRWVFEHALDVRVPEYCVSSCANYVFTAGRRKILAANALVLWHGGATQESLATTPPCELIVDPDVTCDEEKLRAVMAESLARWRRLEAAFFDEIGVRQEITVLGQRPEYDCREDIDARVRVGWYYSLADLEQLGVHDVTVLGGDWRPESPAPDVGFCRVMLGTPYPRDSAGPKDANGEG